MSGELAKALVAAQKKMPRVEPNATNPHFKSSFVTLDHLLAKALPVLNANGIALTQFPSTLPDGGHGLTTILMHESGDALEFQMPLILPKQDPQGQGSALTYARRYAAAAALGISSEKDDDAEVASKPAPKAQPRVADRGARSEDAAPQPPQAGPKEAELRTLMNDWLELKPEFDRDAAVATIDKHRGEHPLPRHIEWLDRQIGTFTRNIEAKKAESQFKVPAPKKAAA